MFDGGDGHPADDHATGGPHHVGELLDERGPSTVEVRHATGGDAELAGGGAGVEDAVVGGVGGGAQHGVGERPRRGVVDRRRQPVVCGNAGESRRRSGGEAGHRARGPASLAHPVSHVGGRRDHLVVDEDTGSPQPGWAPGRVDTEAAEGGQTAAGPVEGVGAEVEIEAVTVAGPGPSAELVGGLEHEGRAAGSGDGGGGGEPGKPSADDDHDVVAIERVVGRLLGGAGGEHALPFVALSRCDAGTW